MPTFRGGFSTEFNVFFIYISYEYHFGLKNSHLTLAQVWEHVSVGDSFKAQKLR